MLATSMSEPVGTSGAPAWPARFGLRAACAYLFLYSFPFPFDLLPHGELVGGPWFELWRASVLGAARVLAIEVPALPAGSGDTTFNYVELLVRVPLALLVALAWTCLPRRVGEARWRALLALHLRYVLALAMLGYGFAKVFPGQFVAPSLDRLTSTYGESSPMGLLWTFMGASRPYTVFGGALEVLSGVLLLFPPTALVGAMCAAGVLANIVALNFCYDVPVKLYSSHLLLMALLLVLPDAGRMLAAAVGRAASARKRCEVAATPRGRRIVRGVHALALASIGWSQWTGITAMLERSDVPPPTPLAGLWRVERVSRGDEALPENDPAHLQRAFFSDYGTLMLRRKGGAERLRFALDETTRTLRLTPFGTPSTPVEPRVLAYALEEDTLVLREPTPAGELEIQLRFVPAGSFLLLERGFHWINEFPLNQ
jgi:uncharacterized membrane protein YphA (DoxX/SURF4 family)